MLYLPASDGCYVMILGSMMVEIILSEAYQGYAVPIIIYAHAIVIGSRMVCVLNFCKYVDDMPRLDMGSWHTCLVAYYLLLVGLPVYTVMS